MEICYQSNAYRGTERGSHSGVRANSQHRSTCRSSGQSRPSILRGNSSYGPDRHPMETFRPCTEINTKLNAQVKPLAPHHLRPETERSRGSVPPGMSLDCNLDISSRRKVDISPQHAALAPRGTRLISEMKGGHSTTYLPKQELGTSSRQMVDSPLSSNIRRSEYLSEGQ